MRATSLVALVAFAGLLALPGAARGQASPRVHELKASPATVHRGFFDAALPPVLTIDSGDTKIGQAQKKPAPSSGCL